MSKSQCSGIYCAVKIPSSKLFNRVLGVIQRRIFVVCELSSDGRPGRTLVVRNIFGPLGSCSTNVYPSILMRRQGPAQYFVTCWYTNTFAPSGISYKAVAASLPFWPVPCRKTKEILCLGFYRYTSHIAPSTDLLRYFWVEAGVHLAGPGIAPNNNRRGQRSSGPTVQLAEIRPSSSTPGH